jgi:hypothetical protein
MYIYIYMYMYIYICVYIYIYKDLIVEINSVPTIFCVVWVVFICSMGSIWVLSEIYKIILL